MFLDARDLFIQRLRFRRHFEELARIIQGEKESWLLGYGIVCVKVYDWVVEVSFLAPSDYRRARARCYCEGVGDGFDLRCVFLEHLLMIKVYVPPTRQPVDTLAIFIEHLGAPPYVPYVP
jgi:hypothetical protein